MRYENGAVRINTTDLTPSGANYNLSVEAGGSKKTITLTLNVYPEGNLAAKPNTTVKVTVVP